jgi:hypothetical protein
VGSPYPAIGRCIQGVEDGRQNAFGIRHHIGIGEAYWAVTLCRRFSITLGIGRRIVSVSIDLHREGFGGTEKVHDKRRDYRLATKLEAAQS